MAEMAEVAKFMTDIEEEAEKWRKWCERQNSGRRDEQQNQGGGNGGIQNGYLRGDQEDSIRYGFFSVKGSNDACLETLEMNDVNCVKNN